MHEGKELQRFLKASGLSLEILAEKLNLSPNTLRQYFYKKKLSKRVKEKVSKLDNEPVDPRVNAEIKEATGLFTDNVLSVLTEASARIIEHESDPNFIVVKIPMPLRQFTEDFVSINNSAYIKWEEGYYNDVLFIPKENVPHLSLPKYNPEYVKFEVMLNMVPQEVRLEVTNNKGRFLPNNEKIGSIVIKFPQRSTYSGRGRPPANRDITLPYAKEFAHINNLEIVSGDANSILPIDFAELPALITLESVESLEIPEDQP